MVHNVWVATTDPKLPFSGPTAQWFARAFAAPTEAQAQAWESIHGSAHTLVVAPTGSGKTLAAFLSAIDHLATGPEAAEPQQRCRVVYISPLKALAADVERNLRSPLVGIEQEAWRLGTAMREIRVGTRTGDTPASARRKFATDPPDILITTPESLFLMLTSGARAGFAGVDTVIVDEIHALAGTKRGAHLALSLERLDSLLSSPAQRIGLSATVEPPEVVAEFLAGHRARPEGGRPVRVVRPPAAKVLDIRIDVPSAHFTPPPAQPSAPGADLAGPASSLGRSADPREMPGSMWPLLTSQVVDLIEEHTSTIVFTNSRRSAERLTARINEEASARAAQDRTIARAHHGSMSRSERETIETALKSGTLPAVVATSSLELGIDMGAVDLVVQVGAPGSVAATLQRIGRAGHQVGATSRGIILPMHAGDLLASAITATRAQEGRIEPLHPPRNPLDVLAQHVVAMAAMEDLPRADLARLARRAHPFHTLSEELLDSVLEMLSGRYPSEEFAELRPRIAWDRAADVLTGLPGASRLAVTSGGTIPDRGLYGVFLPEGTRGKRVGELDEEMVHESRPGDLFTLGSSTWRIEEITPDRVLVSPAPGAPGRLPFWRGDAPARPVELGRAFGATLREIEAAGFTGESIRDWGLSEDAGQTLLGYLREQTRAAGMLATDRTIVVERFKDELGDWRIVVHSPFGAKVHSPWAHVVSAALKGRGIDASVMVSDDGFVLRIPEVADPFDPLSAPAPAAAFTAEDLVFDPAGLTEEVIAALGGSAHFASRFREAAARSLLLPRRRPDRRQPLWQQRMRSAQLLEVASRFPEFPVMIEAARECVQDDFDVPALIELMRAIRGRQVRLVDVEIPTPSPFAKSLLFGYAAQFLYDGDTPLAERRATALTLDASLLSDVLGEAMEVADLLDPDAVASVEAEVGRFTYPVRDAEGLFELIRRIGPLSDEPMRARAAPAKELGEDPAGAVARWREELLAQRRIFPVRIAGEAAWAVLEDAARLRDALGVALPPGIPEPLLAPAEDPLTDLVRRFARCHGPFRAGEVAERYGLPPGSVLPVLQALAAAGALTSGTLRPAATHTARTAAMPGRDYCDADVLRRIRRRSVAALRAEVEPVSPRGFAEFLAQWQGLGTFTGVDGLAAALDLLAGAPIAASAVESLILPARVTDYRPEYLDELMSVGEIVWAGEQGTSTDGWIRLLPADAAADLAPLPQPVSGLAAEVLSLMEPGAGWFARDLAEQLEAPADALTEALWELVWAGQITNDTLAPLRARLGGERPGVRRSHRPRVHSTWRSLRAEHTAATRFSGAAAGRWSRLADPAGGDRRALAAALAVVDRTGVAVRGSTPEDLPGGFAAMYQVLARVEETGAVRRGYFIEGLGATQFALTDAVDRLRSAARRVEDTPAPQARVLSATDPANPYGRALPWPGEGGHRPGRKLGATVVLVGGELALYLERGARTLLTFGAEANIEAGIGALARATREGLLGRYSLAKIDGESALTSPRAPALTAAGYTPHPRGLRLDPVHA